MLERLQFVLGGCVGKGAQDSNCIVRWINTGSRRKRKAFSRWSSELCVMRLPRSLRKSMPLLLLFKILLEICDFLRLGVLGSGHRRSTGRRRHASEAVPVGHDSQQRCVVALRPDRRRTSSSVVVPWSSERSLSSLTTSHINPPTRSISSIRMPAHNPSVARFGELSAIRLILLKIKSNRNFSRVSSGAWIRNRK